jgi:hypothetical protein
VRKIAACTLLAILALTAAAPTYAKTHLNPEARAAQKRAKQQRKAMRRAAKAQQQAMKNAQKEQRKLAGN